MAAPDTPSTRGAVHRRRSLVLRTAAQAALCVLGLLAGCVVGSLMFWVAPLTLALAGGLVLAARVLAGPWWKPLLWGSAIGLCVPFLLGQLLRFGR